MPGSMLDSLPSLVDRQRSGRTVLYQASELGLALLRAGGGPAREVADG